jgi:pectate lyase
MPNVQNACSFGARIFLFKELQPIVLTSWFLLAAVAPGAATTLLDDAFADGTRTNQGLPADSAWFFSAAADVATSAAGMAVAIPSGSLMGVTYFGSNSSSPVKLQIGDTLTASVKFTLNNVDTANTSQGFRLGLFDFADSTLSPKWAVADGFSTSSQGAGVQGYALFQNMGVTFNNASPMSLFKRTTVSDVSLLGTSGDWTALASGPGGTNNFSGFTNGGQYLLQFSVQRADAVTLVVSASWQNLATGALLATSVTDSAASTFNFDGIAFRPSGAGSTATNIIFNEVRVDALSAGTAPAINTQPQDQSIFAGQNATFTAAATGSPPLSYQWYYNNETPLTNAAGPSLTITNAQVSDTGGYSVVVTNAYGSVVSYNAQLAVTVPTAPQIVAQPQSLTVLPGQSAAFTASATGSAPLSYQWYFNASTVLTNATGGSLILSNVQPANAGTYSVVVSNLVGSATSSNAVLSVNTNPVAPTFTSQPASQVVLTGGTAIFSAAAAGTATIYFQWNKNGATISGATSAVLTLTNVQAADAGSYTLNASNGVGGATSRAAVLTVTPSIPVVNSAYNLTGFATVGAGCTGGGVIATNDPAYVQVYTPLDFANALQSAYKTAGSVKVIEIMTNLNLGWNEVGTNVQAAGPFRANTAPLLHPILLNVGESLIDIKPKSGLTIFSASGATMKHCNFNIKSCHNIIVRNLKFDENFEWDENTKGQYDRNDWDFITVGNGGAVSNLWVDHCTFTKSYDGILDTKAGCSDITISWCRYVGDDGATNTNSWLWQQINFLEQSPSSYPMYNFLRTHGFSTTNIVTIMQAHDKTHLAGQNDLDPNNATLSMTFHHLWLGVWDRCVPRLRAGNVHDYNIFVDDTLVLAAERLRNTIAAAMSAADQYTLNNTYDFEPPVNGTISTENGAIQVEKSVYMDCLWPLRNNQTDPSNPAYTGKIQALDCIYQFDATTVRGNSTDPGNPMGPFQAPIIRFSWNTNAATPNGQLPYAYTPDDPAQLQAIVTSPTAGAGAGVLNWAKTNWMMTTYPPTAPFIVAQPQNANVTLGQSVAFNVVAGGSANLFYQWYFNTNTPLVGETNATLTISSAQVTNGGVYSVIVTNLAGSTASSNVTLNISVTAPARPQVSATVFTNGTFSLTVSGDAGHDYILQASTDLVVWASIFTNHLPSVPFVWNDSGASNFNDRFYRVLVGP